MRHSIITLSFLLALICLSNAAYCAVNSTVVFDTSTGFSGLDDYGKLGYSDIRDDLLYQGYDARESISIGADCEMITPEELNNSQMLCIVNPNRQLKQDEKLLLMDNISSGRGLLLVCDRREYLDNANGIASIFGMRFEDDGFSGEMTVDLNGTEVTFTDPLKIVDELANENVFRVSKDKRTIFLGKTYGFGKVGLLADGEVLLNDYIENNGQCFGSALFRWYLKGSNSSVAYEPEAIRIAHERRNGIAMIMNSGDVPQKFNISFTPNIGFMMTSYNDFILLPGEKMFLDLKLGETDYSNGFMNVMRSSLYGSREDHIPIEVV